ncbi:hypothetical protein GLOIN_2v1875688 [Rhizophagus irregularis DAOM 181602=DAOM 197198]|uniref:Protein kinase domain-containing protein n=1 Tax=Rhizophagus irregularis (strain DAOM 181602 / DAOM 197198 / MUCL 43194) TaxID=747089 RepID=A0A2P4Q2H3_RHIID|nr:hypothetical protein GLOIN_2v1875688 [Rhizophagus irregularis DAOM 181602=DAOM 197198]POG71859.1 hypothetical protein GLOIN_2v1875688 [Rhizophagus irregularis DAOM 181602=DAOM 197198]|eukprot:XP_025178725.1 hypothetical protein GLOIN_2v1875688 [Rhizophagus irregularis DAOM 181602=DAOM 197198]
MSNIRRELIYAVLSRAFTSIDTNDFHKYRESVKQIILADDSFTEEEKTEAIRENNKNYDADKIYYNSGTRRICENCNQKCLAILYCEYCVRNYLKANFSNWTSGNNNIDNLIKNCQLETLGPNAIIEWIPYNNLENIEYLTKGGFSKIYTADWIDGQYEEWDIKKQQLIRFGAQYVILKELGNVENASQSWFEEAKSHFIISNKHAIIVECYDINNYYDKETTRQKPNVDIDDEVHNNPNLHSEEQDELEIPDAGSKKLSKVFKKLKINSKNDINNYYDKETTRQKPNVDIDDEVHNNPNLHSEEQDELEIPDAGSKKLSKVFKKLKINSKNDINNYYDKETTRQKPNVDIDDEVHNNPNLHSEEQDELEIPDAGSKKLSKVFKKLKINSKNDINNYYDKETTRQKPNVDIDDEVHNNPNLHSEEQDELEIPDAGSKKLSKVFKKLKINSKNDINNYYDKETTRQKPNVDIDDEVHNNPNLHSEEQDELEIPDDGF